MASWGADSWTDGNLPEDSWWEDYKARHEPGDHASMLEQCLSGVGLGSGLKFWCTRCHRSSPDESCSFCGAAAKPGPKGD